MNHNRRRKARSLMFAVWLALATPFATAQDKSALQRFAGANGWLN